MGESFPLVIVSGLSGSGKSTALHVFEDMGFYAVDGAPVSFVPAIIQLFLSAKEVQHKGIVCGIDVRQPDFMAEYQNIFTQLEGLGFSPQLIFLEARLPVLIKRYATTRRPHPLEREGHGLEQSILQEQIRLKELRGEACLILDTSNFSIHDLRHILQEKWQNFDKNHAALRVHILTFGFKYGTPSEADMVFDLRFLPNPFFDPVLKQLSGKDTAIQRFVLEQEPGSHFFVRFLEFVRYLLACNEKEGRFRTSLAIGCTGGRHRSVAVAESLAEHLRSDGYCVSLEHRHLELG